MPDAPIKYLLKPISSSEVRGQRSTADLYTSELEGLVGTVGEKTMRYGFNEQGLSIAPALHLQATDLVKSVRLSGYFGSDEDAQLGYSAQIWMRVYREVYGPSLQDGYRKIRPLALSNPTLPTTEYRLQAGNSGKEALGSIPNIHLGNANGQFVLLWLRWMQTVMGKTTSRGILIDYYFTGKTSRENVDLEATPSNSFGLSKSGGLTFKTNALSAYGGGKGLFLTDQPLYPADTPLSYYLDDDPFNTAIIKKNVKPISINVPETFKEKIVYSGSKILRELDLPLTAQKIPADSSAGNAVTSKPAGSDDDTKYTFTDLFIVRGNLAYRIALDEDTSFKIKRHIELAIPTDGGGTLNKAGKKTIEWGKNAVLPNLKFGHPPNLPSVWSVLPLDTADTSSYLKTHVVSGSDFNQNVATPRDNQWLPGYGPADNSASASIAARAYYWYVIPGQKRIRKSGVTCTCQDQQVNEASADDAFTAPADSEISAGYCTSGFHFGKFLKSDVNAQLGFTKPELQSYYQPNKAKAAQVNFVNSLAGTEFVGYVASGATTSKPGSRSNDNIKTGFERITFSLQGVKGFEQQPEFSYSGKPQTPGAQPGYAPSTGTTDSVVIIPRDWKKTISAATSKLTEGSAVESLTPKRLLAFLNNRLKEGAPIKELKRSVMESILSAKVALLMGQGKTRKIALAELENDPLYLALKDVVTNLKPLAPRTPGGTETGSTDNPADSGETKTIRITVVRGLPGYRQGVRTAATSVVGMPELVQTYQIVAPDGTVTQPKPRRFEFPFVPKEVNYSGIGTTWTEIQRSGNYPIIDWTGFNLLKISFNFDIVDMKYVNKQGFGLNFSCENQITTLREMAQTPYPVTFLNMDKFMENEVRWPLLTSGRGIEFVISDFSVTAVQRTGNGPLKDGASPNQIARASCSMTLQEIPIESVDLIQMPRIKPCKKNCVDNPPPTTEKLKRYLTFSSGVNVTTG